jgi:hypothetical protein
MSDRLHSGAFALAGLLLAATAQAQPAAPARPDPLDPHASVPPAVYRSAFKSPPQAAAPPVGNWIQANQQVGRIGGWRAYAREAAAPAPAASAPRKEAP